MPAHERPFELIPIFLDELLGPATPDALGSEARHLIDGGGKFDLGHGVGRR